MLPARPGRHRHGIAVLALLAGLALAAPSLALAQQAAVPLRVGRILLIQGAAAYRARPQDPWVGAVSNAPMVAGAALWTEPGATAEIEIGAARFWIAGGTEVDAVRIDDRQVEIGIPQGRVDAHLGGRQADESYIATTPEGTALLDADGLYRIVAADPARLGVLAGQARFAAPGATEAVDTGGEAVASGNPPAIEIAALQPPDAFDQWVEGQEQRIAGAVSPRFVAPGIPGVADLDQYGQWRSVADYGTVWVPTDIPAGWAPYREGNWQWVAPWGWTWIDRDPWGFAPFHYGRWVTIDGWWAWVPGPVSAGVSPVYAPALVSFIDDPSADIEGGDPAVGWVPLGPGEVYTPDWIGIGIGFDIFRRMNYGIPPDVLHRYDHDGFVRRDAFRDHRHDQDYANRHYATIVNRATFVDGQPVRHGMVAPRPGARIRAGEAAVPTPGRAGFGPALQGTAQPPRASSGRTMPFAAPEPMRNQAVPVLRQPQQQPVYRQQQQPVYRQQQQTVPVYRAPAYQPQPAVVPRQPQQPAYRAAEPAIRAQQPVYRQQPAVVPRQQQPAGRSAQPNTVPQYQKGRPPG